ncbi:MAG TPA: polysaccharide biosynthesis/export family protein [Pseudolabrys sp.]
MSFFARNIFCLMLMAIVAGCSSASGIQPAQYAEARASYAGPAPARVSDGPYVLGPGDRLRIKVYSDPDMSGEYEINSTGAISLPLVGNVKALGLTTRQLEQAIAERMKGKVANEPHVSVEMAAYAPFYVYGEVKKAGEYQYHIGLTVADAIATAGGLTYRADEHKISLRRAGSNSEQVVSLQVPVKVYPGDNIRVGESFF